MNAFQFSSGNWQFLGRLNRPQEQSLKLARKSLMLTSVPTFALHLKNYSFFFHQFLYDDQQPIFPILNQEFRNAIIRRAHRRVQKQ